MFIAECPSIPGCISQGKSEEEAQENIQDAIQETLEVRKELGLPLVISTREVESSIKMPPIPLLRPKEVVYSFEKLGRQVVRQKGSHILMTKKGSIATLFIPNHTEVA